MFANVYYTKLQNEILSICSSFFALFWHFIEHFCIYNNLQILEAFTRARFVRLRLLGLRTLYADLMVINQRDKKLDYSVTRRYFYTISDIRSAVKKFKSNWCENIYSLNSSIGGQCICYGHAERCPPDVTHGVGVRAVVLMLWSKNL